MDAWRATPDTKSKPISLKWPDPSAPEVTLMFTSGAPMFPLKRQLRLGTDTSYTPGESTETVRPPAPAMVTALVAGIARNVAERRNFWSDTVRNTLWTPLPTGKPCGTSHYITELYN